MPTRKPSRPKPLNTSKASSQSGPQARRPSAFERAMNDTHESRSVFPTVSPFWLLKAAAVMIVLALGCAWLTLCLLYWQGNWQLIYHPKTAITRTPAAAGLAFEPVHFAATETGATRLTGWWIPGDLPRYTVLYLHSADGNLSDTVDTLATLHRQNLAIFAFDYRGYGQSQPAAAPIRPSEKQLRQDAEWALTYLTVTRAIPPKQILVFGSSMGANLAAELAADHNELAGVLLDQPLQNPMVSLFNDPRSKLVPARWMVSDRYDLTAAARSFSIPSLWLLPKQAAAPQAYAADPAQKQSAWLTTPVTADPNFPETLNRWLDNLNQR